MSESQFAFLEAEFGDSSSWRSGPSGMRSSDPGTAVIYARKALESGVKWVVSTTTGRCRGRTRTSSTPT